jgi:FkbM family methyltransferase
MAATSHLARRIITTGCYEPEVTTALTGFSQLGGDLINVGANIGLYAVWLAKSFPNRRRVLAVEPNPEAYELLIENIRLNDLQGIVVPVHTCVGDRAGDIDLAYIPQLPEYSSMDRIVHPGVGKHDQRKIRVAVRTLDDIVESMEFAPSLIFMDVEGAEHLVLEGAEGTISRHKPIIFFECDNRLLAKFGHNSQVIESLLNRRGYSMQNALVPNRRLEHPFDGDALAIPIEKVSMFRG